MSIKAIFPAGVDAITVNGLRQWDYGQKLEITCDGLPAFHEVHFSAPGMKEAVVRACESVSETAEVVIPDVCLEQAAPITAWVVVIEGGTGTSVKKVTLTVEARTRPSAAPSVPASFTDKYTDLVNAVNNAVDKIRNGNVMVAIAERANLAAEAVLCTSAERADIATVAVRAETATSATTAASAETADFATSARHLTSRAGQYGSSTGGVGTIIAPGQLVVFQYGMNVATMIYPGGDKSHSFILPLSSTSRLAIMIESVDPAGDGNDYVYWTHTNTSTGAIITDPIWVRVI